MATSSLIDSFYKWEMATANKTFLRQPFGENWETYTWKETGQIVRKLAAGLKSLGLREKAHVGLVSKNCREWVIADLAIMMAGYVSVPFYPTLTSNQIAEVLDIGDVDALFVGKMEVWEEMKKGVPADMPIIAFPNYKNFSEVTDGDQWWDFINRFEPMQGNPTPDPKDIWTIIFTSGTTGTPKGVVITHEILDATSSLIHKFNPLQISLEGDNHFFSYLPMNHAAERIVVEAGVIKYGGKVSFVESLETFGKNLSETEPTVFFAVPRIWTKFQLGILSKMPQKKLNTLLKIPIVSSLIKKKIKKGMGFTKCRTFLSGAAPISDALKKWYLKLGIPIDEGYGMTENCAICTYLPATENKPGSVGFGQIGVEMKIAPKTNEILMKAPWLMQGYYKSPDRTAETIREGWLHTGDQGYLDEDGYLFLTGRIKDTFKTAKGKFIVPAPIEWEFEHSDDIEQICIGGLGLPQPIALVVLSEMGAAKSKNAQKESLEKTLNDANEKLPSYQKVSHLVVVKDAWTSDNGLLTPTLKVKRGAMNQRYQNLLADWAGCEDCIVFE